MGHWRLNLKGRVRRMAERYVVPAVKRAFEIIEFLANQGSGVGISDLRRTLGLPLSSTANIVYTLHDLGYLERSEADASYRLSVKLLGIARGAHDRMDLVAQCHDLLRDAVRESGFTAHLAVLRDGESMYIDRVPANKFVQINSYIGQRWPAQISAAGKALLAFLPESQLERALKQLSLNKRTPNTITSRPLLLRQLRKFRRCGYTWERGEGQEGVACVGVPVFGPAREVVAALSLTGTTHQITAANISSLGQLARKYAQLMSRRLWSEI